MALQTFLMVQLGVLALGLGAAFGWRGWQLRRQMTLLTESLTHPEGLPPAQAMATPEAPAAAVAVAAAVAAEQDPAEQEAEAANPTALKETETKATDIEK